MELNIRRLNDEDYSVLVTWWEKWGWPILPKTFLPNTGFIVEKNNMGIVAGYVYMTNSKAALLEWIVSNPEYKESDRKDAIRLLIQATEAVLRDQGIKHIFSFVRHKNLLKIHEDLGWNIDKKPSHEIIKNL